MQKTFSLNLIKFCPKEQFEYTQMIFYENVGDRKNEKLTAEGAETIFYDKNVSLFLQQNRLYCDPGGRDDSRLFRPT